ncbi:16S rRNA (guanine(527)-N(7))-methyltransferase RsmG [Endomicrobium proavitum]|nr:16S rRNA (guanine(527)-N(7))-methyltransferase RsmG [Endomicrobium proavitum]
MINTKLFNDFERYVQQNILSAFTAQQTEKFKIYFDALKEWNEKFNLIHFKTDEELLYRHFADSLHSAKVITEILSKQQALKQGLLPLASKSAVSNTVKSIKVVDLGSGSGMPGIPVKIALPQLNMTLVESITKKCTFLEDANKRLGFDIKVLNLRAEEIGQSPNYRQRIDFVLSRAVSKLSPNLEIAIPLLKIGGYFIVHKTKNSAESLEEGLPSVENALKQLGAKLEKVIPYKLPNQELDYCLLVFKKHKNTPQQYPRKTGIPEKKPL